MTEHKKHLYYMNELSEYKITDGYPDIRGWDVKDFNNRVIGKVDNLLVNKDAERVVYLDVEVDKTIIDTKHDPYGRPSHVEVREFVNKDGENHIIVPIGLVDLNEDSKYVYTDIIDHETFSETKRFRKGDNVNREYEVQVLDSYERKSHSKFDDNDDFYSGKRENSNNKDISESRIRQIVREEIKEFHNNMEDRNMENGKMGDRHLESKYMEDRNTDRRYSNNMDDAVILTDEELNLERRRRNDDVNDDDRFYERREFDDKRFRNRTPGL